MTRFNRRIKESTEESEGDRLDWIRLETKNLTSRELTRIGVVKRHVIRKLTTKVWSLQLSKNIHPDVRSTLSLGIRHSQRMILRLI